MPPVAAPGWRTVEVRPPATRTETWNVLRVALLIVAAVWIYLAGSVPEGAGPEPGGDGASGRPAGGPRGVAPSGSAAAGARGLMPWQRAFRTLGGEDQRLFRELQEGLLEAENARSATGAWPVPAALAARGVPPFADPPAPRQRIYRWELRREGLAVNYLGVAAAGGAAPAAPGAAPAAAGPAAAGAAAFLLLVQEPDPRAPLDPLFAAGGAPRAGDEFHHRLADGTVLHVSTWMLPVAAGTTPAGARPGLEGAPDLRAGPGPAGPQGAPAFPGGAGAVAAPEAAGWLQLVTGALPP